ncbi:MAG: tripartite tricarboxylate transporter substrate binding protein [Burkholderiaceae bacterium]|nr:tripartite tricarboxylate transporter substrate binding protein [Rhodoferax sp.]MCB2005933.1 tripartite tricarboxylate transporter substrate binding protein [Rhodoferax sp.]MCB2030488.1 tripartite tricarboxylate transporter substrate binding protein [Rhodoferax sp.]MCB2042952.1 tripartite tricarboxylate transporter substrate binding protein [Rhodoferax sp.]MCP5259868.1 tripartite tricarboxylate transporter substrate binding protein [Rhodoferax sp.]
MPIDSADLRRRQFITRGAVAGAALALPGLALAQSFPTPGTPLRIVIPAPPGGPADILARAVGTHLTTELGGNPVIVESKPGGASVLAALAVARAPADGYTLFLGINTTHTQVPHMFSKPPYDPFKEFTPITQVYRAGSFMVAHPAVPVADLKELVAWSKANGPVPAGSPGPGTNGHLYIEMLNAAGANFNHVPYKGSADAMRDLIGGFIKVLFDSPATALPHIRNGRIKALAVTGTTRFKEIPEVQTGREQGFAQLDITGWMGFFGPAGMPPAVVDRLNKALVAAIRRPELRAQFEPLGLELTGSTPAEFAALVRNDHDTWGRIIQKTGIKLD